MPGTVVDGCPARTRFHQAVAPQRGVKGGLRQRSEIGRRGVQGTPRLVIFARLRDAIDWGYVRFVLAVVATLLLAVHVAMGRLG